VLNTKTRRLYVKLCNASGDSKTATIDLRRFKSMKKEATQTVLVGQPDDENNYEQQPVVPQTSTIKASRKATIEMAPYSMTMIEYQL